VLVAILRRFRSRLALRIYLASLAQVGAVILGFVLLVRMDGPRGHPGDARRARFVVESVAEELNDKEALDRELDRVRRMLNASISIYDEGGRELATSEGMAPSPPPPRPPPRFFGLRLPPPKHRTRALELPVRLPGGQVGRAVYTVTEPDGPPPWHDAMILALTLVVVSVASLLTARSLARPLARLSKAARAFGAGELDARAGLARSDEIGEVAIAFDEMADRVKGLLKAERELLANVSHELRTPLARIRVALDLAAEGDADMAREALGEIAEDLAELERLISDVLTAARLDLASASMASGIPPLRSELVDARELLDRAASRFRGAHPDRPFEMDVAPDLPALSGDPVLLRRVVDNLLENAHKYSPRADTSVELLASAGDGWVRIEVRDKGVGIAPEDLPRVFEPFFRGDRSRTRATGGLGLGLTLTRRIVEAHRGAIELSSAVGGGTQAVVRLPVAEEEPAS
jgi:two-component system OmpR family sensor kinase